MTVKDLKEGFEKEKVIFGLKEILKNLKGKKKKMKIYVCSDTRAEIVKKLDENKIEFEKLKSKEEVAKELGLNFECEVFSLK